MKKFAFVSDFDGTLSLKDFYHIVIDKYLGQSGREFYLNWKKNKKIDVEFLNIIFGQMNRSEDELFQDIIDIPLDPYAVEFIELIQARGGDFYILSAGTSYYIKKLIKHLGLENITIFSMEAIYKNRGLEIIPDMSSRYFSTVFGVDKGLFVDDLKQKYDTVFFAGDSEPDKTACKAATVGFAKSELLVILENEGSKIIPFTDYSQVAKHLLENRLI
ncbi:MAG: MtnX-like HAD-IB family phosphatase [Fusobacteria bacterium]|nr:MtnX-like HAD-IB family phosphatase [Fusobacteriota bacterium]